MKILQINAVYGIGSTGRTTLELHEALQNNGIESYVAVSQDIGDHNIYKIAGRAGSKLHALLSRVTGLQGYFSQHDTRKLVHYIESINPDVVHLRNLHANYINFPILLEYLAHTQTAVVVTLHDCWFFTGKCMHYTSQGCYKWKTGCSHCPQLVQGNKSWFFDRTKKLWKDKKQLFSQIQNLAVIGVSDWITNEAKQSFLSTAKIIRRIYNWIDLDVFKPVDTTKLRENLKVQRQFIILGVSSGWGINKGLNDFIKLAGLIDSEYKIIIVGEMKDDIELPSNILHIPQTNDVKQLVEYYSMADVFVNFSLEETFGKVTAEALSCGTPAIVYNSTASPELIGEGCGYVAKQNDISEVAEHIKQIKLNGKEFYSRKCVDYVNGNFNRLSLIDDHIGLYQELCEGKRV